MWTVYCYCAEYLIKASQKVGAEYFSIAKIGWSMKHEAIRNTVELSQPLTELPNLSIEWHLRTHLVQPSHSIDDGAKI